MRRFLVCTLALTACGSGTTAPSAPPTRHVLYLTHSAGFVHDVLPLSEQVMRDIGATSGAFDATATKDCALVSAESLRGYDAVIFYTTGELPMSDTQKQALLEFVRSGRGFVGIHSATDTFYEWPDYGQMIGAYFDGHPWHQDVRIRVEDKNHPATNRLPDSLTISDEIYQFRDWSRDRVHVLLSLDPASVDLTKDGVHRTDKDFANAWTRTYGSGRVFYTALGHEAAVWRDTRFQQHLLGGIKWAMGVQ